MNQLTISSSLVALSLMAVASVPEGIAQVYDPSGIINQNGSYEGAIAIDASGNSGVVVDTDAPGATETILKGDIRITVDRDKQGATEWPGTVNDGIFFGNNIDYTPEHEVPDGSRIVLETQQSSDQIRIDVYGVGGSGIKTYGYLPRDPVLIDATGSFSPILITLHNTAQFDAIDKKDRFGAISTTGLGVNIKGADVQIETHGSFANGIYQGLHIRDSKNGPIDIERNLTITTHGDNAIGIYSDYVTALDDKRSITVHGKTNVTTYGEKSWGIAVGGIATFHGNADVRTEGHSSIGIYTLGDLNFLGDLNVETTGNDSNALHTALGTKPDDESPLRTIIHGNATIKTQGNNSAGVMVSLMFDGDPTKTGAIETLVDFRGDTSITTSGRNANGIMTMSKPAHVRFGNARINVDSTKGSLALWANYGTISASGLLDITGDIAASYGGISLHMTGHSHLLGRSYLGTGEEASVSLTLSDSSRWIVTSDSSLTELTLNSGTSLTMGISELTDFTDITASSIALAQGSVINITIDTAFTVSEGDSFRIFIADSIEDDGATVRGGLGSGLVWDTSRLASEGVITAIAGQAIPEPASAAFALFGFASLLARRRRS